MCARDVVNSPVVTASKRLTNTEYEDLSELLAMAEVVEEAAAMINASEKPVIVAGVEIQRFGLQDEVLRFTEKTGICCHNLKQVCNK
jgi:thiamine pyrophosphate-dependent acetolactate synthase large subunit-like protein